MPRSKRNTTKAQKKANLDTKWLNNAMKSIGSASAATFKSIAPNLSSAGTGTMNAVKSASGVVKNASAKKVGKMLSENKYVQLAKNTVNQSIKDIKSGNLYNENRVGEKMMGSMGMGSDDFDDFSDMFDDNEGEILQYYANIFLSHPILFELEISLLSLLYSENQYSHNRGNATLTNDNDNDNKKYSTLIFSLL